MAQYSKHYNNYLPQEKTNFEVVMLADNYGNINAGTGGTATDAFGRSRVGNPSTLFDSQHRYEENGYWDTSLTGSADKQYNVNESSVSLIVSGSLNDKVVRETKRVFTYQPGKSLLIMNSFVFNSQLAGLRQRIGYFGANNGIYFENDGTGNYLVLRRKLTSGAYTEVRVAQADWNVDPFNGTGPTLRTLDISKANIFWMDIEWLGVGDVRCGFVVDGRMAIAHIFHNDNVNPTAYMTTAILPLRMEIENTAATGVTSTAKQICNTVISEGGFEKKVRKAFVSRDANIAASTSAYTPIISFRLNSSHLDAVILPEQFQVFSNTQGNFEIAVIRGGTLNATSWTTQGRIEYNTDASTITGGTKTSHFYVSTTQQSGGVGGGEDGYNWDTQLTRNLDGTAEIVTIAAKTLDASDKNIRGAISYYDLT